MTGQPRLRALDGPDDGREWLLDRDLVTIGRRDDRTIPVLWHAGVSRRHAEIARIQGLYWLSDTKSAGGTYLVLDDEGTCRLEAEEPVLLIDDMVVSLGKCARFRVLDVQAGAGPAVRQALAAIAGLCAGLPHLSESDRAAALARLVDFERRLRAARSEEELQKLAAEGMGTVPGEEPPPGEKPEEKLGEGGQADRPGAGAQPGAQRKSPPSTPAADDPFRLPSLRESYARGRLRPGGRPK